MNPRLYPHLQAIIEHLEGAGLLVGDHQAPQSTDGKIVSPCVVVYMTPSAPLAGSLKGPPVDALVRFRLTSVGRTPSSAADYADTVADAIDGAELDVPDRAIFRCRRSSLAGIERDNDVTPPCFYAATPYQMMSISAPEES